MCYPLADYPYFQPFPTLVLTGNPQACNTYTVQICEGDGVGGLLEEAVEEGGREEERGDREVEGGGDLDEPVDQGETVDRGDTRVAKEAVRGGRGV